MNWPVAMTGFWDELEKISAISTSGLSPETMLNAPTPQPMETSGLDKARAILAKADVIKTAAKLPSKKKLHEMGFDETDIVEMEMGTPRGKTYLRGLSKSAARKKSKPIMEGFKLPTIGEAPDKKNAWDHTKSVSGHGLAGAGAGKMLGEIAKAGPKTKHLATLAGLGVGVADYAYQKRRQHNQQQAKAKAASVASPGMALKASQQVGKVTRSRDFGTSIKKVTPSLGSRGTLP